MITRLWRNICVKQRIVLVVSSQSVRNTRKFGTSVKSNATVTEVIHHNAVEQPNILIVGAGLAGLALAQILRFNNISFQIFERDQAPNSRLQGWAVALTQSLPRLSQFLPQSLGPIHSTSVNAPIGVADVGAILNPSSDVVARIGGPVAGQPGHLLRCRREKLRQFLWQDLPVACGKQFVHYEEHAKGVTAYFNDGSSAEGSILIGLDGVHSKVRNQLLKDVKYAQPRIAPFVPIIGTVTLSREQFESIHDKGTAAVIGGDDKLRWLLSLASIEPDRSSATYFWVVCYVPGDTSSDAESAENATATQSQLFEKAVRLTESKSVPQFYRDALAISGVEGVATPPFKFWEYISPPPDRIPRGRTTFGGDAAHTMMPFKGAGANLAILDVCDFAEALIKAKRERTDIRDMSGSDVAEMLKKYEEGMWKRGQDTAGGNKTGGRDLSEIMGAKKKIAPA